MLGEGRKSSSPIYLTTEGNEDCSCKGECDLPIFAILHLKNFFKSYLFGGGGEGERVGEGQRVNGRERIPGRLRAVRAEPHVGLDPMNREIMTCTEIKSQMLNQLRPQVPLQYRIFILFSCVTPNSRACQVKDRFLVPLSLVCPRWVSEDGRSPHLSLSTSRNVPTTGWFVLSSLCIYVGRTCTPFSFKVGSCFYRSSSFLKFYPKAE